MVSNKCCVSGCSDSSKRKYVFPANSHDFYVWVEKTCNPVLKDLPKDQVRKTYQICRKHFDSRCDSPGTNQKLIQYSLPTLNLPRNILSSVFVSMNIMLLILYIMYLRTQLETSHDIKFMLLIGLFELCASSTKQFIPFNLSSMLLVITNIIYICVTHIPFVHL